MLEAIDLDCARGGRELFAKLSVALRGGELLRVRGANGSGKTSLLRILCGLLTPSAGAVRWKGTPIGELREEYSRQLVYVGHAPAVKDDLTAAENLAFACTVSGLGVSKEMIFSALERFDLKGKDILVKNLSQGQRRRAALARLAVSDKVPLWLLDEPFSALDAAAAAVVEELMRRHAAGGGAVVFTTHQDTRVEATRVVDLDA